MDLGVGAHWGHHMTDAKKVDAWMPMWIGDYLADTMKLSRDLHGGYLLMLFAYWRNKGPLDDDDEDLAAIVKATPEEWSGKLRSKLAKFFTVENGVWSHTRADKELATAGLRKTAAVNKAKAGAEARWGKSPKKTPSNAQGNAPSNAQAVPKQCPPPSPPPIPSGHSEANASAPTTLPKGRAGTAAKPKRVRHPKGEAPSSDVWQAYSAAYQARYGVEPMRNATVSGQLAQFVGRIPADEAPRVAAFFVGHSGGLYVAAMHPVNLLLRDAEKLRTQWATGMNGADLPTETTYQRSMRERAEQTTPAIAARRPGTPARPNPMEVLDGLTRITG